MQILYNIFNLVVAVAAVIFVLIGAASESSYAGYFFITGLVLFGIAGLMRVMAGLFYS